MTDISEYTFRSVWRDNRGRKAVYLGLDERWQHRWVFYDEDDVWKMNGAEGDLSFCLPEKWGYRLAVGTWYSTGGGIGNKVVCILPEKLGMTHPVLAVDEDGFPHMYSLSGQYGDKPHKENDLIPTPVDAPEGWE